MPMNFIVRQVKVAADHARDETQKKAQNLPLTQEQVDTIFSLRAQGKSYPEISRHTGIAPWRIATRIRSGDREGCRWASRAEDYFERAMSMREKGMRWIDIAAELGISASALLRIRRSVGE